MIHSRSLLPLLAELHFGLRFSSQLRQLNPTRNVWHSAHLLQASKAAKRTWHAWPLCKLLASFCDPVTNGWDVCRAWLSIFRSARDGIGASNTGTKGQPNSVRHKIAVKVDAVFVSLFWAQPRTRLYTFCGTQTIGSVGFQSLHWLAKLPDLGRRPGNTWSPFWKLFSPDAA